MCFGTYDRPIADVNLIDAQPFGLPLPRGIRALRLKEWQAFQFGNERYFFNVALFNAKSLALVQVKLYDRQTRTKQIFERKVPPWTLRAPTDLLDSEMHYRGRGATLQFRNQLARGRIEIEIELPRSASMPAISGSLTALAEGCEPQVVCIPFADNRGMYSHKGCLQLEGNLEIDGRPVAFERADSFLLMDDHKGYYPYVMRWDWVTGGGRDAEGRRVGFNFTRNDSVDPEAYNENCVWIDGRLHLLPPVRFTRRTELEPEVWEVRDVAGQGDVEVDFVVELDGHVRVQALVIESRYRGPFGHVRGSVRTREGERVTLDGMFGMGEDFYLRC